MLNGLGRFSAAVWGLVALFVFWLLADVCFSGEQPTSDNLLGVFVLALTLYAVYGLHRLTCWVIGGRAKPSSNGTFPIGRGGA